MSNEKKNIVLIGGGGHCKSCIEVIESTGLYHITGILDLPSELGKKVLEYEVVGDDNDIQKFHDAGNCFLITVGQIKTPDMRIKIFERLIKINARVETVIASTAIVSAYSKIGKGTVIMHQVVVNAGAEVGDNCIVNTASIIEHDVVIEDYAHISTNAVVNGGAKIGAGSFLGSASCVSSGVKVGNNIVLGAGSVVVKDVTACGTYVGNPVRKIK